MSPLAEASTAAGLLAAAALSASAWAGLSATSQLFGPILIAPRRPKEILLTFDDGPNPTATPHLLEILGRHQVHATFFMIGDFARREPSLVRQVAAAGHVIGNHTQAHPWLQFQPESRIRQELTACNRVLEDILGAPVTLFRPPHGARRPAVLHLARSLGLTTVNWNVIVQDWKQDWNQDWKQDGKADPSAAILARLESRIARNQRRGRASNIVLHDGGHISPREPRLPTVEAVDRLLTRLLTAESPPTFVLPQAWLPVP